MTTFHRKHRLPYSSLTAERFDGDVLASQCFWDGSTLSDAAVVHRSGYWWIEQTIGMTPGDLRTGSRFRTAQADAETAVQEFQSLLAGMDEHLAVEGLAIACKHLDGTIRWATPGAVDAERPFLFADRATAQEALDDVIRRQGSGALRAHALYSTIICSRPVPENGVPPQGWRLAATSGLPFEFVDDRSLICHPQLARRLEFVPLLGIPGVRMISEAHTIGKLPFAAAPEPTGINPTP